MKKQVLLSLLILSNLSIALEIPSFEHVRDTSSRGTSKSDATFLAFSNYLIGNQEMPLENIEPIIISWFKENPELYEYANRLHEEEPAAWPEPKGDWKPFNPTLCKYHQDLNEYHASGAYLEDQKLFKAQRDLEIQLHRYLLGNMTYVDYFLVHTQIAAKYFPEIFPLIEPDRQQEFLAEDARCNEVMRVLQKLDIQQTVSDERIDLLADLAIEYIRFVDTDKDQLTFRQIQQRSSQEEIVILKKLLATYER